MVQMALVDKAVIKDLLGRHHEATATKNLRALQCYVFAPEMIFVGTDDSEKWRLARFLTALEETESGWDMTECLERHVYPVPGHPEVGSFFEVVRHTKYGPLRGSGTVVKGARGWEILHYVLSFSVPNDVVDKTNILSLLAQK
jgi:hypothetical protein